jgi:hypothetical protein
MLLRSSNALLRRFVLLFAAFAAWPLLNFAQSPNSGSPQSLTLQEYIAELDRCSEILNGSPIDSSALHGLRVALPSNWTVNAGQARYTVDMNWLATPLSLIEKNPGANRDLLALTRQQLQLHREAAQALATPSAARNLSQSRNRLNAILSAREFRGQRGPSWTDVLKARVWAWIERHLERIFGGIGRAKSVRDIVAWAVIILACLLLLFWTVRFLMRAGPRSLMDLSGAPPVNRDWHRWLRDARDAAARGDYRAAIHAGYWAAIVRMEETNSLPQDRSRTPRESLRLIQKESADYAPLLQLTRRFELVWYGYRSATDADWSDAVRQLEMLGCLRSSTPAISAS